MTQEQRHQGKVVGIGFNGNGLLACEGNDDSSAPGQHAGLPPDMPGVVKVDARATQPAVASRNKATLLASIAALLRCASIIADPIGDRSLRGGPCAAYTERLSEHDLRAAYLRVIA